MDLEINNFEQGNVHITDPEMGSQVETYQKDMPTDIYEELDIEKGEDSYEKWDRVRTKFLDLEIELDKLFLKRGRELDLDRIKALEKRNIKLDSIRRDLDERSLSLKEEKLVRQIELLKQEMARLRKYPTAQMIEKAA
ncbi:MAG: hypothetical protein ABIH87_01255 [bacterium]